MQGETVLYERLTVVRTFYSPRVGHVKVSRLLNLHGKPCIICQSLTSGLSSASTSTALSGRRRCTSLSTSPLTEGEQGVVVSGAELSMPNQAGIHQSQPPLLTG